MDCVLTSIPKVQQVGKLDGIPHSIEMKDRIVYCCIERLWKLKRTRISKLEIPAPLPLCDSPRIPQLSRASTFQLITKSYNTDYKKMGLQLNLERIKMPKRGGELGFSKN
jgi:hypothetical protein